MRSVELDVSFIKQNSTLKYRRYSSRYLFFQGIALSLLSLAIFGILSAPTTVSAATITAASCSAADVQTAVNSAGDGDTVMVPPGSCTWSTRVSITNKSISLIGAGIGSTSITGNDSTARQRCALNLTMKPSGNITRVSVFEFSCALGSGIPSAYAGGGIVTFSGLSSNMRFDHNKVTITNTSGLYSPNGSVHGVADHNTFISNGNLTHMVIWNHKDWLGTGDPYGDNSWSSPSSYG